MAVRNCRELGPNLQKIMTRLMNNDTLVKLLYYNDPNPLEQPNLTDTQKQKEIFNKLIKIVPRVEAQDRTKSVISLRIISGTGDSTNTEFKNIQMGVELFVPYATWVIKDANLRPFAILGEVQESLNGKTLNGIGKLEGGDFTLKFLTEEVSCYEAIYDWVEYD